MKRTQRISKYRAAFTLIEILVVLAIIGVLAAILFPALSGARESGRIAVCSSNLKQIYLGMQQYLNDSNQIYPSSTNYITPFCGWANLLHPYVKSTEIFECPNDETNRFEPGCPADAGGEKQTLRNGSYSYNCLRSGEQRPINASKVGRPADVALFLDGTGLEIGPFGSGSCSTPFYSYQNKHDCDVQSLVDRAETERGHRDGFNFCFADGHVKWIASTEMKKRSLWLNSRDAEYLVSPTTPPPIIPSP